MNSATEPFSSGYKEELTQKHYHENFIVARLVFQTETHYVRFFFVKFVVDLQFEGTADAENFALAKIGQETSSKQHV